MVDDQTLTDEDTIKGNVDQVATTSPCATTLLISDFICRVNFQKFPRIGSVRQGSKPMTH